MSAQHLLETFSFEYADLAAWQTTPEELCVLGFDAVLLYQLGMRGDDVLQMIASEQRGAGWWQRALRYTAALHRTCFDRTRRLTDERHQTAYMQLALAMR